MDDAHGEVLLALVGLRPLQDPLGEDAQGNGAVSFLTILLCSRNKLSCGDWCGVEEDVCSDNLEASGQ